ncbi:MAG: VOC family protein [Chlamydiia bacterium]|nr:VOC family protein [Chlamydiia bacterium]
MTVKGMELCWIVVSDLDDAIRYYNEVIGLQLLEHHPDHGWAELQGSTGARLGLAQANADMEMHAGVNAVPAFTVENLERKIRSLSAAGVQLIGEVVEVPGQVKLQLCEDKDGNEFQFVQILDQ